MIGKSVIAALFTLVLLPGAAHAAWSKAYLAEWFEPALYYGAPGGETEPGTDCPGGSIPDNDWTKLLKTSWRTDAEVATILDPEKSQKNRVGGLRGPNMEDVYRQPWTVPDPGLTPMTGNIAWGFDLDDNPNTGLASPDGKTRGIDNEYYRMAGCWMAWRSPPQQSHHAKYINDSMHDGRMTIVIVVSGTGADPLNDPNVTVGFYLSKDKMVKDANGGIAKDYSFRIDPDPRFQSIIKARTLAGVIESTERADLKMRDCEEAAFFPPQLMLLKAKLRIDPREGGKALALIGGYRPIDDYWTGWAGSGVIHESTTHINLVGYWYGLHRKADFRPDASGMNTAISTAYQMYLTPAFVVSPDARTQVTVAQIFPPETPAPRAEAAATQTLARNAR